MHEGEPRASASGLGPADHACWFFRSRDEHREGVVRFVREAVERRGRVLYLADAISTSTVAADLAEAGLDPDRLLDLGQLVLLSPSEGYDREDRFDPARQVDRYRTLARASREQGYEALWITGEGTWEVRGDVAEPEAALRYELLTERFLSTADDVLALCQYDAASIPPASAERLRRMHNLELRANELRFLGRWLDHFGIRPTDEGAAVSGAVDLETWAAFRGALRHALNRAEGDVVLDLADLRFIDAHGLGIIAGAARAMGPGRRLVLRGVSPLVARMAAIVGLNRERSVVIGGAA